VKLDGEEDENGDGAFRTASDGRSYHVLTLQNQRPLLLVNFKGNGIKSYVSHKLSQQKMAYQSLCETTLCLYVNYHVSTFEGEV
jgi:hypothetical protein